MGSANDERPAGGMADLSRDKGDCLPQLSAPGPMTFSGPTLTLAEGAGRVAPAREKCPRERELRGRGVEANRKAAPTRGKPYWGNPRLGRPVRSFGVTSTQRRA